MPLSVCFLSKVNSDDVVFPGDNVSISDSTIDHSITLSGDLGQIFDSGIGCDFLISAQSPTGNRQEDGTMETVETTICAHKMVLSQLPDFSTSEGNATITVIQPCQPYVTSFIRYEELYIVCFSAMQEFVCIKAK